MKKALLFLALFLFSIGIYAQWTSQRLGFPSGRNISDISIVNANTVWVLSTSDTSGAASNYQTYTKTTNGGTTWTPGTINIGNPNWQIVSLTAIDNNNALVGAIDTSYATGGGIWSTIDGGATWFRVNSSAYQNGAAGALVNGVYFFDANNGLTFGDPVNGKFEIYKTSDGGYDWIQSTGAANPDVVAGEYGASGQSNFAAAVGSFWFTTSNGKIYRTTDKGATWSRFTGPTGLTSFYSNSKNGKMIFSDANNGLIYGTLDTGATFKLWKTSDGGASWDAGTAYTQPYQYLSYVPGTTILVGTGFSGTGMTAVASSGKSLDNGVTWSQIDTGTYRYYVKFINTTTGWASKNFTSGPTDGIFKFTGSLGVNKFMANSKIVIYPNPTNSVINFETDQDIISVTIVDVFGRITKKPIQTNNQIDVSDLSSGLYYIEINTANGIFIEKFVKAN